jgi:hypothetical protein
MKCKNEHKPESLNNRREDAVEQMHKRSVTKAPVVRYVESAVNYMSVTMERRYVG